MLLRSILIWDCIVGCVDAFTSQSTIFQSSQDFSTKDLAQGHKAVPLVRYEPMTPQFQVKYQAFS